MKSRSRAGCRGLLAFGAFPFVLLLLACGWGDPPDLPTITAQGFDITAVRESNVREEEPLRLRIEAPGGLESLLVQERSYEVDLARSREPSHFPLFGLPQRVWSKTDITLDFGPYIASKLTQAGDYSFHIVATDREAQSSTATLRVRLRSVEDREDDLIEEQAPQDASERSAGAPHASPSQAALLMDAGDFRLERIGAGPVVSNEDFGITWRTIESNHVVIRIVGVDPERTQLVDLDPGAFAEIETSAELADLLDGSSSSLDLATANDAAAGAEIAIVGQQGSVLLRTDGSETRLSEQGTTVTLTGRYKR